MSGGLKLNSHTMIAESYESIWAKSEQYRARWFQGGPS